MKDKNIYEKIQIVKEKLLESNVKKSGKNKFANYTYYELADIIPHIIKLCNETRLYTKFSFDKEAATLTITNVDKPEEFETYTSPMEELELKGANRIQALGGTETYQRRYLYMAAFDIIENDMFDSTTTEQKDYKTLLLKELDKQGINRSEYGQEKGLTAETTQKKAKELLDELRKGK